MELCRACKLYDFERHCWTDFKGNPTSELGLPSLAFNGGKAGRGAGAGIGARSMPAR
jgi:hypothetical protein